MTRWGKKSKSYNVFLNALYHCKQLFDLSNQSADKGMIGAVDNEKNNKIQNFSISSKKRVRNPAILPEKATLIKNRISFSPLDNTALRHVDICRGTWNRFRKNLLVFNHNQENAIISFFAAAISNRILEVRVRFSQNLYYSFTDLCTTEFSNSQLKEEQTFLSRQTNSDCQQFSVKKRLISRRVGLKVAAVPEFLKQGITTKKIQFEGLIFRDRTTDSLILDLVSVVSIPKLLQSKILHLKLFNSNLLSSYLKRKQILDLPAFIRATHEKLIDYAQGNKEQDFIKIYSSMLLKKKINANNYRGVYGLERLTVGIKSVSRVSPSVEVRKVRIGGATYAVPYVPHNKRQEGLGIRWLIDCASLKRERSKHPSEFCLATELADSLKNQGESMKKRDQSHQIAAANRAYTRYRWW